MKQRYALLLAALFAATSSMEVLAQCTGAIAGTALVPNPGWTATGVPPTLNPTITGTSTNGSNILVVATATGLSVGTVVTGPNIPPGTTITAIAGTSLTLSNAATGSGGPVPYTFTISPGYALNYPPPNPGFPAQSGQTALHCTVCPVAFETNICANQFARYYMCPGNVYTITLCNTAGVPWNSTLSITNAPYSAGYDFDDDGCGTVNGFSTITFVPTIARTYAIRVLEDPCIANGALCGLLQISCAPGPPPPPNDEPCNAIPLPVSTVCTYELGSTAYATSTSGIPVPNTCGASSSGQYGGYDVFFSAVVPPSGNLSIQTSLVSAGNIAMAAYLAASCQGQFNQSVTRVSGSNTMTTASTANLVVGMAIQGAGIPAGSVVTSIVNATTFTISNNALSNGTAAATFNVWQQLECNQDAGGVTPAPFLTFSGLPPGATVYIRVWPEGFVNTGTFEICAYEPVPPPNDNPCGAIPIPVAAPCTPGLYSTESATPLAANMTANGPTCGLPVAGGDVWFQVTMPPSGSMTISTIAGSLTDMAMAVYTLTAGNICGPGTLTQVAGGCNDNNSATNLMPEVGPIAGPPGNVYYVRVWNKSALFGTFQICAVPNTPPANDDPCGALPLTVRYGCIFDIFTNAFASQTGTSGAGWSSAPNPAAPCADATPSADVWFTAVVPPNGELQFDTDDGLLQDAGMTVYTATGSCGSGNLALTQVGGTCGGSAQNAAMPFLTVSGLTAGSTVYVRVWRQTNTDGNFQLCARRTNSPPGTCDYTLRMNDTGGDGWNGGYVRVCVGAACTNYSIVGSTGFINFSGNVGQTVTFTYFPVGGFQNQISYSVIAQNGFAIYNSGAAPAAGPNFSFVINADCNVPPAPPSDCAGSVEVCTDQTITGLPNNTGNTADLNASNRGCLSSNEVRGQWFRFTTYAGGTVAFTLQPGTPADYDWAIWGPYIGAPPCPPSGPPLRCSYAAGGGPTGLNMTSVDLSEGAGGDRFVRYIDALAGQTFLMYIDRFSSIQTPFELNWNLGGGADINCLVLPVQMLSFDAKPNQRMVDVTWTTASERNSDHFSVERSGDGDHFVELGKVNGMGNSQVTTTYAFVDQQPHSGMNYYRLKQVDQNGEWTYSETRSVFFRRTGLPIELYPNPARESIAIAFDAVEEGAAQWRVLDMSGRIVLQGNAAMQIGTNRIDIALERVENGSYMVELLDANSVPMGNSRFVKH
ncbi:MAG: T9SS type A sorting domain-containing protein [Flavobacteriales bacterium]